MAVASLSVPAADFEVVPGHGLGTQDGVVAYTADPIELIMTMQRVAVLLKEAGVPFALAGSMAVYAHGGVATEHDVDFLLRQRDVPRAVRAAREAGMQVVQPPEDWLVKLYDEDRLVDLIYRPVERPVTDELLAQAPVTRVYAVSMPVLPATQLIVHKLLAISEHSCDFSRVLPACRSLREQVDWAAVAAETGGSPFAAALLYLLDLLQIVPGQGGVSGAGDGSRPEGDGSRPEGAPGRGPVARMEPVPGRRAPAVDRARAGSARRTGWDS